MEDDQVIREESGAARPADPMPADQPVSLAAAAPDAGPLTLSIDIGGTRLKAGVLDPAGKMLIGPLRTNTPQPATPAAVLSALEAIVTGLGEFHRISIGFPGVVRHGRAFTAPNLGTEAWHAFPLVAELSTRLGRPARLLNDATVQGLGVIAGNGLECILTLGTGMGFALFQDGMLTPQIELGQHIARKRMSYDQYIGNAAYAAVGAKRWNRRLRRVIAAVDALVNFDTLLIGGGNAKHINFELPPRARVVPNEAGITGGVKLWEAAMDDAFVFRGSDEGARRGLL
jgi:polyphosphate glucokinase